MQPFWGKYRGAVIDDQDPLMLGRLLVSVPGVTGATYNWAMPCVPYAGPEAGVFTLPPIGTALWVEFEGGDPDYPIWTGRYWRQDELSDAAQPSDGTE